MQRFLTHALIDGPRALRSPVALFAAVVAASVALTITHLIWLSEYAAP